MKLKRTAETRLKRTAETKLKRSCEQHIMKSSLQIHFFHLSLMFLQFDDSQIVDVSHEHEHETSVDTDRVVPFRPKIM